MDFLEYYKNNKNNFSYWFPKIKDCGIAVPRSIIVQVPEEVGKAYFMDNRDKDQETVLNFVKNVIKEHIPKDMFFLFMKNGTFSNKFSFNQCKVRKDPIEITSKLIEMNYSAEMLGAGGLSEVVFREFIGSYHYIDTHIPCIYNGMPLRPEFRVFYDFDEHKVLYSVNYWDYDYCYDSISRNITDKIVYIERYKYIKNFFDAHQQEVEKMVKNNMYDNNEFTGKWSIDIMYNEEDDTYYLIDMAIAETSAYWKE